MGLFGFINSCLINIVGRSVGRSIVCVCVWEWCLFFCVVRYRDAQQNVRTAFGKIHVPQMPSIIIVGGSSHRLRSAEIDMGFIFIDVSFAPATAVTHGRTSFFLYLLFSPFFSILQSNAFDGKPFACRWHIMFYFQIDSFPNVICIFCLCVVVVVGVFWAVL